MRQGEALAEPDQTSSLRRLSELSFVKQSVKVLSPAQRIAVTVVAALLVIVIAGAIYLWVVVLALSGNPGKAINPESAQRIANAAKAYAHALRDKGQPVPASIPLSDLVKFGMLRADDVSVFQGLDAMVGLQTNEALPISVLMRVHMSDGSYLVLLGDGSVHMESPR